MSDEREGIERNDDRGMRAEVARARRPYVAPELVEYGTVAKLTQTGNGSIVDFGAMMSMMP